MRTALAAAVAAAAVVAVSAAPALQFPDWQWIALALTASVVLPGLLAARGPAGRWTAVAAGAALAWSVAALLGGAGAPGLVQAAGAPVLALDAAAVLGALLHLTDGARSDGARSDGARAPAGRTAAVIGPLVATTAVAALGYRLGAGDGAGGLAAAAAVLVAGCPCALLLLPAPTTGPRGLVLRAAHGVGVLRAAAALHAGLRPAVPDAPHPGRADTGAPPPGPQRCGPTPAGGPSDAAPRCVAPGGATPPPATPPGEDRPPPHTGPADAAVPRTALPGPAPPGTTVDHAADSRAADDHVADPDPPRAVIDPPVIDPAAHDPAAVTRRALDHPTDALGPAATTVATGDAEAAGATNTAPWPHHPAASPDPVGRAVLAAARRRFPVLPGVSDGDGEPVTGLRGVVSELAGDVVLAHAVLAGPPEWLHAHGVPPTPGAARAAVRAAARGSGPVWCVAWDGEARGWLELVHARRPGARRRRIAIAVTAAAAGLGAGAAAAGELAPAAAGAVPVGAALLVVALRMIPIPDGPRRSDPIGATPG